MAIRSVGLTSLGPRQNDDATTDTGGLGASTSGANANAQLKALLDQWGLGSLAGKLYQLLAQGYDADYIAQQIRESPEYAARFPAIAQRRAKGLAPISEADYVALEHSYSQILHNSGLTGFFGNDIVTKWIAGDVSPAEVNDRAKAAYAAALGEPLEVRQELQRIYGDQAGSAAAAYYLDPSNSLPELQRRLASGEIAGASSRTGYGLLSREEAEALAAQGVSAEQAQQGFSQLGHEAELFGALPGQAEDDISREDQLAAEFGGNAEAQRRITQRQQARAAAFAGGGGFARTKTGVGGLGTAQ